MKVTTHIIGPVRFAEKTSRNTVLADLLGDKTWFRLKKQAESTDYKRSEQGNYLYYHDLPLMQYYF